MFCNPCSGNEKGLVENLVGYIRRNVCVSVPRVKDLDELNDILLAKCVRYGDHRIDGRTEKVSAMLEEEHRELYPVPKYVPDISKKVFVRVNRYSVVTYDTNSYSVPCQYCGRQVTRFLQKKFMLKTLFQTCFNGRICVLFVKMIFFVEIRGV